MKDKICYIMVLIGQYKEKFAMSKKYDLFFLLISLTSVFFTFVFALPVITRVIIILTLSFMGFIVWIIGLIKSRKVTFNGGVGFGIFLLNILIVLWGIQSIIASDNYNYSSKLIGVKVPRTAQLLEKIEDHGGFHGDGESYLVFKLSDTELLQVKTQILKNGDWLNLPLQGSPLDKGSLFKVYGNHEIPLIARKGFYYFTANKDHNYGNFTFSILDYDNKTLYILRVDT